MHVAYVPTTQDNTAFGRRLIQARQTRKPGMSAPEAAAALGIAYPTYKAHENGSRGAPRHRIEQYCKFYGINFRWLATGAGPMRGEAETVDLAGLNDTDKQRVRELVELMKRPLKTGTIK